MAKRASKQKKPDLTTILRRLNPNVPAGLQDDAMPRIPRDDNALRQIRAHLRADPMAKLLLSGHIGVGKSTELGQLAREMEDERCVVRCSVADTLGAHNVTAFSLLVLLMQASIRSWVEKVGNMPAGLVEELGQQAAKLFPASAESSPGSEPASTRTLAFSDLPGITGEVVKRNIKSAEDLHGLYVMILKNLRLRAVGFRQSAASNPSPVAQSCKLVLKELDSTAGKPVFLVIDDLDKVRDTKMQREIFVSRAMAWLKLPCGIASTVPLDAIYSPIGQEIDQTWGNVQVLDPLPVPAAEGEAIDDPALQPYLSILRSIEAHEVLSALQCRRLANASSGLPRSFVSACATCLRYVLAAEDQHVRDYHVDLVLGEMAELWRPRLEDSDYAALVNVVDTGGSNIPAALHLLRDGILIRDGEAPSEDRFRLATWAEPFVETYRQRMQKT